MFKVNFHNKNMKKQQSKTSVLIQKIKVVPLLAIAVLLVVSFSVTPRIIGGIAGADAFDEQIKQLQNENANKLNNVQALQNEAASFEDAISRLQTQINAVQAEINVNLAKQAELQAKIEENQRELERQRSVLGTNIRVMYVEGQITTIEMLATSKNLSEFVDKEEYRTAVKNKIQDTLKRINDLQNQMKEQKLQVEKLLADQKAQQAQLAAAKAEQNRLLTFNVSQQNEFNAQVKGNQNKISELRRQQAVENSRLSGGKVIGGKACDSGNGDTYPAVATNAYGGKWGCSFPIDNNIDNWGMYNRQCVSYTAWKVHQSGRHVPYWGGHGNANQWDDNARAEGIPVDTTPRFGDVAVKNSGTYGHVLYVEHVYGDGSILVSDYNQQFDGAYRRYTVSASAVTANNLQFIHFP